MTSAEYCKIAVKALEDKKAEDVKVIDIREISPIADFFIIADGMNQNQIQAMRDAEMKLYIRQILKYGRWKAISLLHGF